MRIRDPEWKFGSGMGKSWIRDKHHGYATLALSCKAKLMMDATRGLQMRCRHSWLTNSVLVYEPKCGGGELRGLS
jgi:hypothetical protein